MAVHKLSSALLHEGEKGLTPRNIGTQYPVALLNVKNKPLVIKGTKCEEER